MKKQIRRLKEEKTELISCLVDIIFRHCYVEGGDILPTSSTVDQDSFFLLESLGVLETKTRNPLVFRLTKAYRESKHGPK